MGESRKAVVVSAHAGDFVWRAGGAIALHAEGGWDVLVVCLSLGERGESAQLWRRGMTLEAIKTQRKDEAVRAAEVLGARIEFFDIGDYPMRPADDVVYRLASIFRELRPVFILTHSLQDPYNFDHSLASHMTQEARIIGQAHGHDPEIPPLNAPHVFLYEPHQPEQCGWKPQLLLDISSVWEKKRDAFRVMAAQEHMWAYYERVALQRGAQATRNSGIEIAYAEAYQRLFPEVSDSLQ